MYPAELCVHYYWKGYHFSRSIKVSARRISSPSPVCFHPQGGVMQSGQNLVWLGHVSVPWCLWNLGAHVHSQVVWFSGHWEDRPGVTRYDENSVILWAVSQCPRKGRGGRGDIGIDVQLDHFGQKSGHSGKSTRLLHTRGQSEAMIST